MLLIVCPLQCHIIIILSNGDEKVGKKLRDKSGVIDSNVKPENEFGH